MKRHIREEFYPEDSYSIEYYGFVYPGEKEKEDYLFKVPFEGMVLGLKYYASLQGIKLVGNDRKIWNFFADLEAKTDYGYLIDDILETTEVDDFLHDQYREEAFKEFKDYWESVNN